MSGTYDPDNPVIIFERQDRMYRSWKPVKKPQSNAVIVYMMDVSGSMGHEQKELVRLEAFWIDAWLRRNYEGIESRYIVHDVNAQEVDRETFFRIREDGGTKISSAFKCCRELLDAHYNPDEWNIYLFHFSDGDNSSESDSRECCRILKEDPAYRDMPIIMVTALNEPADMERARELGAECFLTKPVNKNELLERVQNLLQLRKLKSQSGDG